MSRTRGVVLAGGVGSAVEWFDFGVYGYLAPVMGARFFPSGDPAAAMLSGFAVFSVGYFMRPLGGLVLGRVGDRLGRRAMLLSSVLAMGVASVLIGLLPTHEQVGLLAPALLVLLRCVQGMAVGGEYTGAMAYTSECAPPRHRGLVSSMATVGVCAGLVGASGSVALVQACLTDEAVRAWGWRVPFLCSALVAIVGLLLRRRMPESPSQERRSGTMPPGPWPQLLVHGPLMLRVIAVIVGANAAFYAAFVFMPDRLADRQPELAALSQTVNTAMLVLQAILVMLGGWLSDRFGRRRMSLLWMVLLMLLLWPAWTLGCTETLGGLVAAQVLIGVPAAIVFGMQGALVAEMCPGDCRCTVYGVSYGLGIAAFAGTVPVMATWMMDAQGWRQGPLVYLLASAAISAWVLWRMRPADLGAMDREPA